MSLAPQEDTVPATARELREIVEMRDLSDIERLTALREAYAQIVAELNYQIDAVDSRVDKRRLGVDCREEEGQ